MKNHLRPLALMLGLAGSSYAVPPTVALTAPSNGAAYSVPATVTLTATAVDADGYVISVEFFNGATKVGQAPSPPYPTNSLTLTLTQPGTYTLTACATDNTGAAMTSAPVTVNVLGGLPFLANFEPGEGYVPGALAGQNGWSVAGSANIVASPVAAGQQAVSMMPPALGLVPLPALLSRFFANSNPGVTFVDFFALPAVATTADTGVFFETDTAEVALTHGPQVIDTGGMIFGEPAPGLTGLLQVFDGDGTGGGTWRSTETGPVLDPYGRSANWLRLTTRHDFASKKWDLYFNGRMIAADLGFLNNSSAAFSSLGLSGHASLTTGFDELLIAFDNPLFADADKDGMADAWETAHGLNPSFNDRNWDRDGDGVTNVQEYLLGTNPNDGTDDTDGDGLTDERERTLGTNPNHPDSDGDSLPDGMEFVLDLDPTVADPASVFETDADADGLTLREELEFGTDPTRPDAVGDTDTDGDGLTDLWETKHGSDPRAQETAAAFNADTDGDGLTLLQEARAGTSPGNADTDGDGLRDDYEVNHLLNPLVDDRALDPDGDGLSNLLEFLRGTDPQDYYNGEEHEILPFIGGDGDLGAGNLLAVRVTDRLGTPLVNAPVIFELTEGTSQIALTPGGPAVGRTAEVRTGAGGIARVFLKAP